MLKSIGVIAVISLASSPVLAQQTAPVAQPASGWVGITYSGTGETDRNGNMVFGEYPIVVSVDPGSPAAKAGILAGDTVVAFNNRDLLRYALPIREMIQPGKMFVLRARRSSGERVSRIIVAQRPSNRPERLQIAVTPKLLTDHPGAMMYVPAAPPAIVGAMIRMSSSPNIGSLAGAELRKLDGDLAAALGVKPEGLFVVNVLEGSPAQESGLRSGDVVLRADSNPLGFPQDLSRLMRETVEKELRLDVIRRRKAETVSLRW